MLLSAKKHLFRPQHYEARNQLQEKNCKNINMWRLNNMLLNNQWISEEIKEGFKKIPRDK